MRERSWSEIAVAWSLERLESDLENAQERIRNLESAAAEQQTTLDTLWRWAIEHGLIVEDEREEAGADG